jgi:protein-tyrosine phosphatase
MRHPSPGSDVFRVLLVCTGNICRSALAERLGRAYLDEVLGDDAGAVELSSAGTQAVVGSTMHPDTALVVQGFGGDPATFRARQLVDAFVVDADLILTMTRAHMQDTLQESPRVLSRTFTLREAADLVSSIDEDRSLPGSGLAERARSLVQEMASRRSGRRARAADDVPDPIGRPVEVHLEAGELIAGALIPVLARISSFRGRSTDSAFTSADAAASPQVDHM